VFAWNLTAEIYAANGERRLSHRMASNFATERGWIDNTVGDGSVTLVGQQFGGDTNGINLLEFFNRSIKHVWSVDPSSPAPGPGPTQTPDLTSADGRLTPEPGTDYALAVNGVRLQGDVVRGSGDGRTTLYRLDGPLRLFENQTGVASDGWMGKHAAYNRFDVRGDGLSLARVTLDRIAFCTAKKLPSKAVVRIGPLGIGADKQPALSSVTDTRVVEVPPCQSRTLFLRPPPGPWRVEVDAQTFVIAEIDPRSSDRRELGVRPAFGISTVG
jgi:hypothetical protein